VKCEYVYLKCEWSEQEKQYILSDRTIRRIKAILATLFAIGCTIAGTTDFTNNVLEISNKLGVPIVQAQPIPGDGLLLKYGI
jgi:hypothetical protein